MMEIQKIVIPKGTRYLSQVKNLAFPEYPIILDKKICDCGCTYYFLSDNFKESVILCSPRRNLIQTKVDNTDLNIFWYDTQIKSIENDLCLYFVKCKTENIFPKICTTYDTFPKLISKIGKSDDFRIIIDECQLILQDSGFKSIIEMDFMNSLKGLKKSIYLSATPPKPEYCNKIECLKDLPKIELVWNKDDISNYSVQSIKLKSKETFQTIVKQYQSQYNELGYFNKMEIDGNEYLSKELVIYVSNISLIRKIISSCNLSNTEVYIIASEDNNKKDISKLKNDGYLIGKPQKRGENHYKYTFCTRTAFVGADFYSTNASSIIFSNTKIDSMITDILLDVPQIIGRERLKENMFRYSIKLYIKDESFDNDFELERKRKLKETQSYLNLWEKLDDYQKQQIRRDLSREDSYTDFLKDGTITINDLKITAEDYANEIRNQDTFKVELVNIVYKPENDKKVNEVISQFNSMWTFESKMKLIDETLQKPELKELFLYQLNVFPEKYRRFWKVLGSDRLKANGYNYTDISNEYNEVIQTQIIKNMIYKDFGLGWYSSKMIKDWFIDCYCNLNIKLKPSATDIEKYFDSEQKILKINGSVSRGFLLKGYKQTL